MLLVALLTLGLIVADTIGVAQTWPFVPATYAGDDLGAIVDAQTRSSQSDSFLIGLAVRSATDADGAATLVLPVDGSALHDPYSDSPGQEYPWMNEYVIDDLLASDIQHQEYETRIASETVEALLADGTLYRFSTTVIAPPPGSIADGETLAVFAIGHGERFVVLPLSIATESSGVDSDS